MTPRASLAAFAAVTSILSAPASGQSVQAVLSADTKPYQEAWDGFHEEMGGAAAVNVAGTPGSDASIESARVVVAFGSKAALQEYRADARVIITMAPSVSTRRRNRSEALRVTMTPGPAELLSKLRALQPGMKSLAVVWKSEFYGAEYFPILREAGKSVGVEIVSIKVGEDADIPDLLRSLYGRADALWLPPDPLVISERNFLLFRDFSLSNRVPLYVPIHSLAEHGATASVGVGFREIGRAAARAAKQASAGNPTPPLIFPEPAETTLNRDSAARIGLAIDAETLKNLSRVVP